MMPNTPTWTLDESTSSKPASNASNAPRESHQPFQTLSLADLARLETVFKALLDAQKHSIHKRIQTLLDKNQESHAKVIEAAEALLKDRKRDRAEQARMSSVAPQPQLAIAPALAPVQLTGGGGGPSKEQWDALMEGIQCIHERLDFLTERFAGVADEPPPDGHLNGDTHIPQAEPDGDEFTGDIDVDADGEGDPDYANTGSDVVGDVSHFTTSDDATPVRSLLQPLAGLALPYHQSPPPDPISRRSETVPPTPRLQDTSTGIDSSYQSLYYPSPISQAHAGGAQSRDLSMSMSQEPTQSVGQGYPFHAIGSMGAYSDSLGPRESSVPVTVRLQDVELISGIPSTSSLSSLSPSPPPVIGKRRRPRTPKGETGGEKRRRGPVSLKSSSISWPKLIPHKPGMTPQRIYCDRCQRFAHLECVGISDEEIPDKFLCPLCEKFGPERAERLSMRRTSTANERCIRPNCPQKRKGRVVKKETEREFTIECIVGRRGVRPNFEYLVKWDGYGVEHCEWKGPSEIRIELLLPSFEEEAAIEGIDLSLPTGTHFLSEAREFWGQFRIERIVGRRPGPYSEHEYLCKWLGWGVECSEWKPEQDFVHGELVEQFEHAAKYEQFNLRIRNSVILLSEAQVAWGNTPASKYFPPTSVRFLLKDEKDAVVF